MDFFPLQADLPSQDSGLAPFPRLASLPPARYYDPKAAPLVLGQNAPNPHEGETFIPFTLLHPADVRLEIFDLLGRKMAVVVRKGLGSGEHRIQLDLRGLCLPLGDYPYQLQATSVLGVHRLDHAMTLRLADAK